MMSIDRVNITKIWDYLVGLLRENEILTRAVESGVLCLEDHNFYPTSFGVPLIELYSTMRAYRRKQVMFYSIDSVRGRSSGPFRINIAKGDSVLYFFTVDDVCNFIREDIIPDLISDISTPQYLFWIAVREYSKDMESSDYCVNTEWDDNREVSSVSVYKIHSGLMFSFIDPGLIKIYHSGVLIYTNDVPRDIDSWLDLLYSVFSDTVNYEM